MNYDQCLTYLESLSPTLEKPMLTRIALFMQEQGSFENHCPVVHVGGTNGKGSTAAILDSLLRSAGLKVGRYTGPHLIRWNERFHIDGSPIRDDDLAGLMSCMRELSEKFGAAHPELGPLTWFEFLTAVAFFWFAESQVDTSVIEVGLGGRFDATNIVENVRASVITNVDLDHTQILGDTVQKIAFEKAGIIKATVPVVTACTGEALDVIIERARTVGTTVVALAADLSINLIETNRNESDERLTDTESELALVPSLFLECKGELALPGAFQEINAFAALTAFMISGLARTRDRSQLADIVRQGFREAFWPGRLQYLAEHRLVLDGAHNEAGARALRDSLERLFPERKFCFLITCFFNKKAQALLAALVRPGDTVLVSEAGGRRPPFKREELAQIAASLGADTATFESVARAFEHARKPELDSHIIVATGSFATVKEVALALGWRSVEDGRAGCAKITGGSFGR